MLNDAAGWGDSALNMVPLDLGCFSRQTFEDVDGL